MRKSKNSQILKKRRRLSDYVPLKTPYAVTLHMTTRCNSRCIFCIYHSSTSPKPLVEDMEFLVAKKVIDQLKKHDERIKALHISGIGEPLLNTETIKIVKYAKEAGIADVIDLITNGILLTEKKVDALLDAGVDVFRVSVNGLSDQDYLHYTESPVSFNRFVAQLEYLFRNKKKSSVHIKIIDFMVNTPEKKKRFQEVFDSISDSIEIEYYCELPGTYKGKGKLTASNLTQRGETPSPVRYCPYPFYYATVLPNGDLAPCPNEKMIISNINNLQNSDTSFWDCVEFNRFRVKMLKDSMHAVDSRCKACVYATSSCAYNDNNIDCECQRLLEHYELKPR